MKFLIIVGTAREGRKSIHPARKAEEEFQEHGYDTVFYDIKEKDIPPLGNRTYIEDEEPVPDDIEELSKEIEESEGIVMVTPEYNHSIPGVLKNALDHLYPEYENKPFSYITVSAGGFGGVRALDDLKDFTVTVKGLPGPNLPISNVGEVFTDEGELEDEDYIGRFEKFVKESVNHVKKSS